MWYVLLNADDDPVSISSLPITEFAEGFSVVEVDQATQPNVETWADPVAGADQPLAKVWDRTTKTWLSATPPTVKDRILDDLSNDEELVALWQSLTVAQRTALRTRLARLLGRRRYRYASEPVDLGD